MPEILNSNNLTQEDLEELKKDLEKYQTELKNISLELDLGLIDEGNQEYIDQNRDKIDRAKVLGAKIDFIKEKLK